MNTISVQRGPRPSNQARAAVDLDRSAEPRTPVDSFFERVTVNADDAALRLNRLRLLAALRRTMQAVADFGRISG